MPKVFKTIWFIWVVFLPLFGYAQGMANNPSVRDLVLDADSAEVDIQKTLEKMPNADQGWLVLEQAETALKGSDYKNAMHKLMQSQANFEKDRDELGMCLSSFKLGVLYQRWKVYERAISYYTQAEPLANAVQMPLSFLQNIWMRQAFCAQKIHQNDEAVQSFKKILLTYKKQGNTKGIRAMLTNLANLYQLQEKYDQALDTYLQLLKVEEEQKDLIRKALTENNIGYSLKRLNKLSEAKVHFQLAITELEKHPDYIQDLVSAYINLGSIYSQLQDYDPALLVLEQAYQTAKKGNQLASAADVLNISAITLLNKGSYTNAMRQVDAAIELAKRLHNRDILVRCYRTKAQLYDNLLNFRAGSNYHQIYADLKDSIRYEERMVEQSALMQNLNVERLEKDLRLIITDTEKNQLVLKQSALEAEREIRQREMFLLHREKDVQDFTYKAQALELDRIKSRKRELEAIDALRVNELEGKESELRTNEYRKRIDERNHQTSIRLLAKDKELLEQSQKSQQESLDSQREREKLMFGLILLAIVAVGATYAGLSRVKTANLKLRVQQDEVRQQKDSIELMFNLLETKNKSITDSIKYARRIQSAVVPGVEILAEVFPLSFVLLRPRDVVSGDVYYVHRTERYSFLASIDCTGHGVPGAMLSVIGHQTLDNIIKSEAYVKPHTILHALDHTLASILRSDQYDLQQGMDIGLLVIDRKEQVMHFSGAVHNLIYVQNGALQELKASRCSIGGLVHIDDKVYETHTLSTKEPMYAYLYSDGLPTQLGGPQGKKYSSNRLKEVLLSLNGQSASAKKATLELSVDEWIGTELRQLDDILVLGFRPDLVA